jgi:hypothetical protein
MTKPKLNYFPEQDIIHLAISEDEGELISGNLRRKQTRLIQAWIELHEDSLMVDWELAISGQEPLRIEPLR